MTELGINLNSIKQQLSFLATNSEQFQEKLTHIGQTRSKINNQVISLTKDYDRKIKQLQAKLEEAVSRNQVLSQQNILYRKDIEAFQARLVQKEKLIAMLIMQQSEKFNVESVIGRSKTERAGKKNYQNLLPKNIPYREQNEQNPKKEEKLVIQGSNTQEKVNSRKTSNNNEQQQKSEVNVFFQVQKDSKAQIGENNQEAIQRKTHSLSRLVPPPPGKSKKLSNPPAQINSKKVKESSHQQNYNQDEHKSNFLNPTMLKQQIKETENFVQKAEHLQPNQQKIDNTQQQGKTSEQQKRAKVVAPPPPSRKIKNPLPPKKANIKQFHQEYLEDEKHEEMNQPNKQQIDHEHAKQNRQSIQTEHNVTGRLDEFKESEQALNKNGQQKKSQISYEQSHVQQLTAPRSNKMVKPGKKKGKLPVKPINQVNFYEQVSNENQNSQQNDTSDLHQPQQQYQAKPSLQFEVNPSSQDFFANFGVSVSNSQNDFGTTNKLRSSHMMQVQQSSIDYADSHSVVSSTLGQMLDSQYIPEDLNTPSAASTEMKPMTKKKNHKRQIKQLDPSSFQ